jgi:thymidylate synthase (FAD)
MNKENYKSPQVYMLGATGVDEVELKRYLFDTDQLEFLEEIAEAKKAGLNIGEILCSFYAKACYASLTTKKNKNISKTRDIESNIHGILNSGHGSVTEHCQLNFMITGCSRVFTHELVRHRVGTAFSQTSGRYVRSDKLDLVIDPILEPAQDIIEGIRDFLEHQYKRLEERMGVNEMKDFGRKKKVTSAMRRILPNGQSNEIGFSVNLRTLRHTIQMRTSEHAEWEIREVFAQIYSIVRHKYPAMFFDAEVEMIEGLPQVTFKNPKV